MMRREALMALCGLPAGVAVAADVTRADADKTVLVFTVREGYEVSDGERDVLHRNIRTAMDNQGLKDVGFLVLYAMDVTVVRRIDPTDGGAVR